MAGAADRALRSERGFLLAAINAFADKQLDSGHCYVARWQNVWRHVINPGIGNMLEAVSPGLRRAMMGGGVRQLLRSRAEIAALCEDIRAISNADWAAHSDE